MFFFVFFLSPTYGIIFQLAAVTTQPRASLTITNVTLHVCNTTLQLMFSSYLDTS